MPLPYTLERTRAPSSGPAVEQTSIFNPQPSIVAEFVKKATTREGWLGEYDYAWLCTPRIPFLSRHQRRPPPFYGLDDELPLLLALTCGLQHALAMLAGIITPPIIFASAVNLDPQTSAYMISSALITSGLLSLVQVSRIALFRGYYLGTGLLSVVGTSFSVIATANATFNAMYRDGTCPSSTNSDGTTNREPCPDAYGMLLGTSIVCAFFQIFLSFIPIRFLRRTFPPLVTGTVILLIGASLVGQSGAANWGGGANGCLARPTSGIFQLCPTIFAPRPLPWGSPQFIGLGFLSLVSIILTELYGSHFLQNASIIVGLVVGSIVAGATGYFDGSSIKTAPVITFLWVHRFKLRVYPPAILPMLATFLSISMEAMGDITASAEASNLPVTGATFDSRIQGGILADGIGGCLSGLFTTTPLSVFAQNNGVISLTRCANRSAGRWCCFFLILFGVLGKIAGVFLAIPNPVLGGVTTLLFASVGASGLRVLSFVRFSRRDRFILATALSFGVANLLDPDIFLHLFDGVDNPSKGLEGLFNSITILLSTPFLAAGLSASIMNAILPRDEEDRRGLSDDDESSSRPSIEAGIVDEGKDVI